MNIIRPFILVSLMALISCAEMMKVVQSLPVNQPLTQAEIVAGLKEALRVGTDSSVRRLAKTDGYYRDPLVKILLPSEADVLVKNINRIPGGSALLEDVVLKINRAAEDAVSEAAPIFWNSITGITIPDAVGILKGGDNAATNYLRETTYNDLFNLYSPKIKTSLDKKIFGEISASNAWNTLTSEWNKLAKSVVGQMAGFKPVDLSLNDHLTAQALNGLFLKIGEEEKKIRQDPVARVTDILRRVFSSSGN